MRKAAFLLTALSFLGLAALPLLPALADAQMDKPAPDFALPNADGTVVKLSDFHGKKVVVVYFYPKDETPGCTTEACSFRDKYDQLKAAGAEVIGISSDSSESHKKFAEHRQLPFILLADEGAKVRKEWGVPNAMGVIPGRVTYVIDKDGVVRLVFSSLHDAQKHVEEAVAEVNKLKAR
jgi:peroxiredoxin Q/BCP